MMSRKIVYHHCNALVVRTVIAHNSLRDMLVDTCSCVNILFESAFVQMQLDHSWTPMAESLYGFTRWSNPKSTNHIGNRNM